MREKQFIEGNEAICLGAICAGCRGFFGYPITPQNEVPEIFSRELPKIGGVFVQAESETASINMLMGGSMTGHRVITSTSGPGFSLMQEGISNMSAFEIPGVIVEVTRMGPGQMGGVGYSIVEFLSACPVNWAMSVTDCLKFMDEYLIKEFPIEEFKNVDRIDYSYDEKLAVVGMAAR